MTVSVAVSGRLEGDRARRVGRVGAWRLRPNVPIWICVDGGHGIAERRLVFADFTDNYGVRTTAQHVPEGPRPAGLKSGRRTWTGVERTPTVRAMSWTRPGVNRLTWVALASLLAACSSTETPKATESETGDELAAVVDPLPSWNDSAIKARLLEFVAAVTDPEAPTFVEPAARVAVFDNDGTLWVEQPMVPEMAFAVDRVIDLAKVHPEWKTEEPFKTVLSGNTQALLDEGTRAIVEVVVASHTGMSTTLFDTIAAEWLRDAVQPRFKKPYTELAYQPQLELLRFLEANGFSNFIVSGGTAEFIRVFSQETYGIPPPAGRRVFPRDAL